MDKERGENRWFKKVYKEGFAKANIQIVLTDLSRVSGWLSLVAKRCRPQVWV
ncbi:unnamed protein product [Brassica oleracea var. botrytis]